MYECVGLRNRHGIAIPRQHWGFAAARQLCASLGARTIRCDNRQVARRCANTPGRGPQDGGPVSTRNPKGAKRQPTGIRARHSRRCATHSGGNCNCTPSWEAFVFLRREGRKVRKTFPTLAEARRWRHDAASQADRGALRAPTRLTLSDAATGWLEGARAGSIRTRSGDAYKPSAIRGYEEALRLRVLPDLGGHRLADIARRDVQALVGRMLAEGLSPSTIRNSILPLRAIFRHHRDDVPINPTAGLDLPAVRGVRDRVADPVEAEALLAALEPRDRALWATALYAGLRLGELRGLGWGDIDLAEGLIRVQRSWDAREGEISPKSRAGVRRVPMIPELRDLLVEHRLDHPGDGLVFGADGRPFNPTSVAQRAKRAWQAARLDPITLHECRHTFASLMIAAGVNAKALSTFLGHSSVTITFDRYGHLFPGSESEAADVLHGYLARARAGRDVPELVMAA
jgi:integrase